MRGLAHPMGPHPLGSQSVGPRGMWVSRSGATGMVFRSPKYFSGLLGTAGPADRSAELPAGGSTREPAGWPAQRSGRLGDKVVYEVATAGGLLALRLEERVPGHLGVVAARYSLDLPNRGRHQLLLHIVEVVLKVIDILHAAKNEFAGNAPKYLALRPAVHLPLTNPPRPRPTTFPKYAANGTGINLPFRS
ncbi:hypothetical protein GNI_051500 [Gregarina niphandrodes]|uniref:Uncharacterized protein n=1 Tax=Gregarina niphandrodes TaxID=110365 RepID=A0A023B9A1_GRENI|nr:hypothetical protein GNI_051500 [Gregarina niphandrodes]EZG72287.1 hypothetical protein GNI_051500 [Gregarina niphandrodes]|eukprot:XP_011129787.1 hypothetical protein GNI_051500 [Gregarina niphandrodes]